MQPLLGEDLVGRLDVRDRLRGGKPSIQVSLGGHRAMYDGLFLPFIPALVDDAGRCDQGGLAGGH